MRFSIISASYNRAHGLAMVLDAMAVSIRKAGVVEDAEIIIVDNNSTDDTPQAIDRWVAANPDITLQHLFEPVPGASSARNRGIRAARGALLAFTDDDCLLTPEYVAQALAYDAVDGDTPVIRGGRIELYDTKDIPLTIKIADTPQEWSLAARSARHENLGDSVIGCNMTVRKTTFDAIGLFDTRFGPGTRFHGAEDLDICFRAYLAGVHIKYVPDMVILHNHGRDTKAHGNQLMRSYVIANGGLYAKYMFRHTDLMRPFVWSIRNLVKELRSGQNLLMPEYDFSYTDMFRGHLHGMAMYVRQSLGLSR